MWRPENFKNPYGEEWWVSACQHQYNLGDAYETGFNDCLEAIKKVTTNPKQWLEFWKALTDDQDEQI